MAKHDQHHYNPRFWLNAWRTPPDGLLSKFFWDHGKFVHDRRSSKSIACVDGLYALRGGGDRNKLERDFFGKEIDNPGAVAFEAILKHGIDKLTDPQVWALAKFVGMQILRSPKAIENARKNGRDIVRKMLEKQGPGEVRGLPSGQSLAEYVEARYSHLFDNVGPLSLPIVANSARFIGKIRDAHLMTLRVPYVTLGFLIGDYPVIYDGSMNAEFAIAFPLSPHDLFLAASNERIGQYMASISPLELIDLINQRMVEQAQQFVCGVHESQTAFVEQHLKQPSRKSNT